MPQIRSQVSRTEVDQSIREIRDYHKKGRASLQGLPEPLTYAEGAIRAAAANLDWNETKLRKARQFADPTEGYSIRQLNDLCRLLRKHRPQFGTAHIGILVTVSWRQGRARLQRHCIEQNWSKAELEAEIKLKFGNRRQGGRRRAVVADQGHLLVQLSEMADTWQRWYAAVEQADDGEGGNAFDQLPSDVRTRVDGVNRAIRPLSEAVTNRLRSLRAKLQKKTIR